MIMARLNHDNIAKIIDFGYEGDVESNLSYIITDFVEGGDLFTRLKSKGQSEQFGKLILG